MIGRWQTMRVFVKVAPTNGFAEAARHLHMSPPAVTRAVAERLGASFFGCAYQLFQKIV